MTQIIDGADGWFIYNILNTNYSLLTERNHKIISFIKLTYLLARRKQFNKITLTNMNTFAISISISTLLSFLLTIWKSTRNMYWKLNKHRRGNTVV